MNKIAIVGPIYPWRGGIAHHTSCLTNAFVENGNSVHVFSFSRQYPKWLYPGGDQKENSATMLPDTPTSYSIDTLNPLTWWKTYKMIKQGRYNACVFKYWHFYFVPCFTVLAFLLRKDKIKTICIIDNLYAHERGYLDEFMAKTFFHFIDFSITQSDIVDKQFGMLFPQKIHTMIPHPRYDSFGKKIAKETARKLLQLPANKKILLFFGFIRPYKGLDILINALPEVIKGVPDIHLVIAGECFGSFDTYQKLILKNKLANFITLHINYIEIEKIPFYFSAADIFVMPYRSATNSGVMEIAHFYGLPILASLIPAFSKSQVHHVDFSNHQSLIYSIKNTGKNYSYSYTSTWFNICEKIESLLG